MKRRPITAEDLLRLTLVGDPRLSPDCKRVLFTRKTSGKKNNYVSELCTVDLRGAVKRLTKGAEKAGMGRWSPDGTTIAFICGKDKDGPQIHLMNANGKDSKQLTSLDEGSIGAYQWSPDGKYIAFTFRPTDPAWTNKGQKERKKANLSTPPRVVDDIWYKLDGDGYFLMQRYEMYLLDVASGECKPLYAPLKRHDGYTFDWSPKSDRLVVAHTVTKSPLIEADNDGLFIIDLNGKAKRLEGLFDGSKTDPKWSPDGKTIAFVGVEGTMNSWGTRNSLLYVVPATGGEPKSLMDDHDYGLHAAVISDTKDAGFGAAYEWAEDGKKLYAQLGWHGAVDLVEIDAVKGGVRMLTELKGVLSFGDARGSLIACLHGNAMRPQEVAVVEAGSGKLRALTNFNKELLAEVEVAEPEELWAFSTGDTQVHGWVLKPCGFKLDKKYPAVLQVHGGPHAMYGWAFFHEFQLLAANGYVVVFGNPRGSKGYGEKFCDAIRGDWGNHDWDDVQALTKLMADLPYVDSKRMGVMGGSYGGYMTNWAVGHTKAFKAAITDRCVSNMVSMAGSSDSPFIPDHYWKGTAFSTLENIADLWRQSPIAYFDKVTTPMLIIHSEGDLRCNVEQSEQVFGALQVQGVESRFVRYPPSTFHGLSRSGPPDLRLHRLGEILAWWKAHL